MKPPLPLPVMLTKLFSSAEQLSIFISYLKLSYVPTDEYVFRQGDRPDGIYLVIAGQVSPIRELSNGQTKRLRTFGIGDVVGEAECYCNVPRAASLVANQPSYLYHLSNHAWDRMEEETPAIASEFHKYLLGLLAIRTIMTHSQPAVSKLQNLNLS